MDGTITQLYKFIHVCKYSSCGRECIIEHDIVDKSVEHNQFRYLYYLYLY